MDSARAFDPLTQEAVAYYAYVLAVLYGALLPDATILRDTADILARAEQSGDDVTLFGAEAVRSVVLIQLSGVEREAGFEMLAKVRERVCETGSRRCPCLSPIYRSQESGSVPGISTVQSNCRGISSKASMTRADRCGVRWRRSLWWRP